MGGERQSTLSGGMGTGLAVGGRGEAVWGGAREHPHQPPGADEALGRSGTHAEDEEKLNEHGAEGQDPGHENAAAEGEG